MQTYVARVRKRADLTHDVRVLTLELSEPPEMHFLAGQFISFSVPKPGVARPLTRPYSIVSSPANGREIELLFNYVPEGPGSTFLYALQDDDRVEFRGPAGTFVLHDYPDRELLLVATDTGIAPLRSILLARLPSPTPVTLFWGLRSERDLYYQDELHALAARHPEFSFSMLLSHPSPDWLGKVGRVEQAVESWLTRVDNLAVYVCGNSSMIAAVVSAVKARGTCPIHREQYYKG